MRTNRSTRAIGATTLGIALAMGAVACGNDSDDATSSASQSSATEHNDADVAFATDMLQHHAQALEMVDLTQGRALDPEVQALAEQIRAAQTPEIETFTGWLTEWDEPVPDTSGEMGGMDMSSGSSEMPGMMSADDMTALENALDTEFQTMWLEMMTEHHEGALDMAKAETEDGQYQPAVDLAGDIITSQTAEIETMKELLG